MSIYRGAGGSGDAVADSSSEASLVAQLVIEAQADADAAAASATSASSSATSSANSATSSSSSASAASTSETNASNSATTATTKASEASTSATNAASSASSASTSASTVTTQATNASNSASAASTSATNASNSATAAANSATTASAASAAALTALDNFDDRYLGSKSTAPTVDNDGNTLAAGALYFNTVSNSMKVYTGTIWVDAYADGNTFLAKVNNLSDLANQEAALTNLTGFTSTATAAGTTTLTNTSSFYQLFTGTTTQTVVLPVASTLQTGWTFHICNNSTGTLTVNSSGGNLVISVIAGTTAMVTCVLASGTTAASWEAGYTDFSTLTGTGAVVLATSPTLVTPALGTPASGTLTNCTFPTLNQSTTGSAATLTTGRTLAITGDLVYTSPSFNGSANVTAAGTLATVNTNVGSFTNASVTVNAKGLVTAASNGTAPVTSVTGTSPVASSGGVTPAISLSANYGDTLNPYASKTANYVLAAPNGIAGVPTFRAVVATDIPTLNQNTTGTASNVTGTVAIANGGTGATTRQDAMDALAGAVTSGQYLRGNGTDVVMSAIQAADVPTLNQSTTGSAATLTTGRTVAITGDLTYTSGSFNGSANVTGAGTLATVNSNVGSFGSSNSIPVVTVNAKGLVTAVTTATVAGGQYFGSAATKAIAYNSTSIAENITTTAGNNCLSVGPITIASGNSVTIASGQRWVIL